MDEQQTLPGKIPSTPLAGPYGHPFHPILVTVPIGAWVASLVFDVASHVASNGQPFATGARWLIALGVVGALLAAVFGLMDLTVVPSRSRAFVVAATHLCLNVAVIVLFAVSFFLRSGDRVANGGLIAISVIALVGLAISGWLGGMLAYRFGIRVAREVDQLAGLERAPLPTRDVGSADQGRRDVHDGAQHWS